MSYLSFSTLNSLDEFSFIAGNTYTLEFTVFEENGITPVDLSGATIVWTLCPYGQPTYSVLQKTGSITGANTFSVSLTAANTLSLSGKYIHQPVITSFAGSVYRPAQGVVLILPAVATT